MEAKDTVLHLDDIDEGRMPDSYGSLRKALEKQAEISFKAGYGEGVKNHHGCCQMDYKAGIKEVVDWVEEHTHNIEEWTGWQEQKEEWGMDE